MTIAWLHPGERVIRPRSALGSLIVMGSMLDQIDIYWPIPESVSIGKWQNFDCFTRQHG